jgi:hypothetical protein
VAAGENRGSALQLRGQAEIPSGRGLVAMTDGISVHNMWRANHFKKVFAIAADCSRHHRELLQHLLRKGVWINSELLKPHL